MLGKTFKITAFSFLVLGLAACASNPANTGDMGTPIYTPSAPATSATVPTPANVIVEDTIIRYYENGQVSITGVRENFFTDCVISAENLAEISASQNLSQGFAADFCQQGSFNTSVMTSPQTSYYQQTVYASGRITVKFEEGGLTMACDFNDKNGENNRKAFTSVFQGTGESDALKFCTEEQSNA